MCSNLKAVWWMYDGCKGYCTVAVWLYGFMALGVVLSGLDLIGRARGVARPVANQYIHGRRL